MSQATSGVDRAYSCDMTHSACSICKAQQSERFPQDYLCHFVFEFVVSPKNSRTQIIARVCHSSRLTYEDTEYNFSVY